MKTWPAPGTISEFHAVRDWRGVLQANGYRVIEEPWEATPPERPLPPPAVKPPGN